MQVHKMTVMVIDHDELGAESASAELEAGRFGNRCISPDVMAIESREIGEWDDDNPLNGCGRSAEFERLFAEPSTIGTRNELNVGYQAGQRDSRAVELLRMIIGRFDVYDTNANQTSWPCLQHGIEDARAYLATLDPERTGDAK
jgi:hypothetical protein